MRTALSFHPKKRKGTGPMTKEEIEAAKKAAFAAKPHIESNKRFKGKDYRDEIDSIIKPGEEDNLDFSDDELSQVLKMQVKKEPDAEPIVEDVKPADDSAAPTGEDKLSSAVPEDVSLNTPVSNPDEIAAASETSTQETSNGTVESSAAQADTEKPPESKEEGVTEDSVNTSLAAKEAEGGDLEGSVTAEDPPNFDSDNEVVDDEVVDEPAAEDSDLMSQVPPPTASSSQEENMDVPEAAEESTDPVPESAPPSEDPPMDTSVSNSDEKSEVAQQPRTEIVNGQSSLDSRSAEEDLLTSTTNMEEGDEQYKNIIAESQMDNIFN